MLCRRTNPVFGYPEESYLQWSGLAVLAQTCLHLEDFSLMTFQLSQALKVVQLVVTPL